MIPPSFAPALATARVIVRAPASNIVTPSSAPPFSIRYTLQRPGCPCTTHTPVATSSASPAARPAVRWVLTLNAPVRRCSAFEPAAASSRPGAATVIVSVKASFAWINPSRTVSRSKPSSSIWSPVGAIPPKRPGPANVPVNRHCTRAAVALGGRREHLHLQIGHRSDQLADELAHALRREHVDLAAHVLAPSVGPHRRGRLSRRARRSPRSTAARPSRPRCPPDACGATPPGARSPRPPAPSRRPRWRSLAQPSSCSLWRRCRRYVV